MKIRMVQERTGPRHDGRAWPPVGGEIDLDDEEGAAVCAAGWAVPVARLDADVEVREEPAQVQERVVEIQAEAAGGPAAATEPPAAGKPANSDPKAAWVRYAAAQGYSEDDAAGMTKADLIEMFGGG